MFVVPSPSPLTFPLFCFEWVKLFNIRVLELVASKNQNILKTAHGVITIFSCEVLYHVVCAGIVISKIKFEISCFEKLRGSPLIKSQLGKVLYSCRDVATSFAAMCVKYFTVGYSAVYTVIGVCIIAFFKLWWVSWVIIRRGSVGGWGDEEPVMS